MIFKQLHKTSKSCECFQNYLWDFASPYLFLNDQICKPIMFVEIVTDLVCLHGEELFSLKLLIFRAVF
jgi:hypothetical protein